MVMSASRREQGVPQRRVAVHQRLGPLVVLRRPAFDQVGRQRERAAGEADQRRAAQLGHQRADRLGDVGHVARLERRAAGPGRARSRIGCPITGPMPGLMSMSNAHRPQRDHDVAEQDGGVHVVPAQRLQGDLGDQVRLVHASSIGMPSRAPRGTPAASGPPGA